MNKFFADVVAGAKWIGKKVESAASWLPKLLKIADDVEGDAVTLIPELVVVIEDVEQVGVAAIADGGAFISDFEVVGLAISQAVTAKGLNFAEDAAVIAAVNALVTKIATVTNYAAVFTAVKKLVTDYDTLGASVKTALTQLEADAKA